MVVVSSQASDELRSLIRASTSELDAWLSQEIADELGTRAHILRAIAWCRRGALARARADVEAALAKVPVHEMVELTAAMISFVTRDYDRTVALLQSVAQRHRYMAAQTSRVLVARLARLGWTQEQREVHRRLSALGVRDLRAHIQRLQAGREGSQAPHTSLEDQVARAWSRLREQGVRQVEARISAIEDPEQSPILAAMRTRLSLLGSDLERAQQFLAGCSEHDPAVIEERLALALAGGELEWVADHDLGQLGPRAWRLKAEALLELGRPQTALDVLARADTSEPDHAHAALISISARAAVSGEGPSAVEFLALDRLAPGLLSDAARELGLTLWTDGGLIDDPAILAPVCERARTMLTAERASSPISYRTTTVLGVSRLRHVPEPALARGTHSEDAQDLAKAAQLLLRSIEKDHGSSARPRRSTPTRSLDAAQIDAFMADGCVHLRGAFSRELADSLVASVHRRLRQDPTRWLSGDPDERRALAQSLVGYDPEDPQTWPEGRVDILGERKFTISEFSPFAERAVFQLLGDAARIRTRSWTSNVIAQYPRRDPIDSWVPSPEQESWHLDSPSTHTRLDQLHTGLLVFIVLSDLEPASGNTWLALDSPARVARALAAAPEGIDFCHDDPGPAITKTCTRLFEVTGEAGDLYLVHPLMLHSASPNPSPRIRFLCNPMVYLQSPLDPRRPDASPVERSIALALGLDHDS